ncbi:hypothetical protein EDC04DRAFT_2865402 [Pisolithus marmoratus]|nr:hypothetical protein EDC04DRAFT_2865402 [Pisolithus marmoratus]
METNLYYHSLPSSPKLVACTSTTPWEVPANPEAYCKVKELHVVGNHVLQEVWKDNLALKVHALWDSNKVKWTSTDVIHIGMMSTSLSGKDSAIRFLKEYNIDNIKVKICELLDPAHPGHPSASIHDPLTMTLSLSISDQSMPWSQGTGGFFITKSEDMKRLLLIITCHVVFPLDCFTNDHFKYKVRLLSDSDIVKFMKSIQATIKSYEGCKWEDDDETKGETLQLAWQCLAEVTDAAALFKTIYHDVEAQWATLQSCGYTQDWALIEIDSLKLDIDSFTGNVINIGLLQLKEIIGDGKMCKLTALYQFGEPCIMVIKHNRMTSLTIGQVSRICSHICFYSAAILLFDNQSVPLLEWGDSGAVIMDGHGHIVGLMTGGTGTMGTTSVTCATPIGFMLR